MRLWEAVRLGQTRETADLVLTLDAATRRTVASELPQRLKEAQRQELERIHERRGRDFEEIRLERSRWVEPLRVVGAGTIAGVAGVATWLNRRDLTVAWSNASSAQVLRVIAARPVTWQSDLAVRMASRLRGNPTGSRAEDLALDLLRQSGAEPPAHDPLVVAWVEAARRMRLGPGRQQWANALTWDGSGKGLVPTLRDDPLLHHLLPRLFEAEGVGRALRADTGPWLEALRRLEQEGRIDRKPLVHGCVTRFLRGGSAADLRFFVRLHEQLDPAPGEAEPYVRDYLRLLPAAPGPVAELALRRLGATGQGAEAVEALLYRPEGKLVRAGLTRFARLAEADRDRLAPALAAAFLCESPGVRDRAVRLAARQTFTPAAAESIRESAATLPPALAELFGAETDDTFVPGVLPDLPRRQVAPYPGPGEVAPSRGALEFERWLDWFVREGAALAVPLTGPTRLYDPGREWREPGDWVRALLRESSGQAPAGERGRVPAGLARPQRAMLLRCAEVLGALAEGRLPPYLLASPTATDGGLDPAELARRLAGYERAGVEPMPRDLQQALLRLPHDAPWPDAARPAPVTWIDWSPAPMSGHGWRPRLTPRITCLPTGMELVDLLLSDPYPYLPDEQGWSLDSWSMALPYDRELVATHLLPQLSDSWERPRHLDRTVAALLDAGGAAGEGLTLLVAWLAPGTGSELLLRAVSHGGVDPAELGRALGTLLRRDEVTLKDVLETLERCAGQGVHREVWTILTGMLPEYLPADGERGRAAHATALGFAVRAAGWAQASGEIPAVSRIAGRGGGSAYVSAARELDVLLRGALISAG